MFGPEGVHNSHDSCSSCCCYQRGPGAEQLGTPSGPKISVDRFLPARHYASARLCDSDMSVCLSVRASVCHTPVLCLAERKQDREMYTI